MSLLLDALDRAERSRHSHQGTPPLALGLEAQPAETPAVAGQSPGRAEAANLFLLDRPATRQRWRRLQWPLGAAFGVLLLASSVFYLSWPAGSGAAASPLELPGRGTGLSSPAPAAGNPALASAAPPAVQPPVTAPGANTPATTATAPAPRTVLAAAVRPAVPLAAGARRSEPADPLRFPSTPGGSTGMDAAAATGDAPSVDIHLFRSQAPPAVDPDLRHAWDLLHAGQVDAAHAAYLALERAHPNAIDVQLGLARIAAERGAAAEARQRYQRALVMDPQNATAQAGLAVLDPTGTPAMPDASAHAGSAGIDEARRFALATRFSAGGQWPEAEQLWFEAVQGDPDNPDLLFNLAVALDHLGQGPAARQHYQDALKQAGRRPAHFASADVERRIRALAAP